MIRHRGPDDEGFFFDPAAGVGLASRRLSVIDIEGSRQPVCDPARSTVIVFNGEIYNFRELREELAALGFVFRTQGDTEVILHAHAAWGDEAPARLRGMFAYAIWDGARQELLAVRDPVGIKPLHYYHDRTVFAFASEIKALLHHPAVPRALDLQSAHDTLNLRYVPGSATLFQGIRRLPAGHILKWRAGAIEVRPFWQWRLAIDHGRSAESWGDELLERLDVAVRRSLVSDVPVGLFLSGGLDSSSILQAVRRQGGNLLTFTVAFNEPTDEHEDARRCAEHFGAEHRTIHARPDFLSDMARAIFHVEEPKVNQIQGLVLARAARQVVKVALSGVGGDELFGGYWHYRFLRMADALSPAGAMLPRRLAMAMAQGLSALQLRPGLERWDEYRRMVQMLLTVGAPDHFYGISRNVWDWDRRMFARVAGPALAGGGVLPALRHLDSFLGPHGPAGASVLERGMFAEFNLKLRDDFLVNEDRTSSAVGLEARPALLDLDLVSHALSIPGRHKVGRMLELRPLFKQVMARRLPDFTLRKPKWGFAVNPVEQWKKDLRSVAVRVLTREKVEALGLVRWDYVRPLLDAPADPRLRWHFGFLWQVVGLHLWADLFLGVRPPHVDDDFSMEAWVP